MSLIICLYCAVYLAYPYTSKLEETKIYYCRLFTVCFFFFFFCSEESKVLKEVKLLSQLNAVMITYIKLQPNHFIRHFPVTYRLHIFDHMHDFSLSVSRHICQEPHIPYRLFSCLLLSWHFDCCALQPSSGACQSE